jgi:hypothetical protein
MFKIESEDNFFLNKITESLIQFDIPIINKPSKIYGLIELNYRNNKIDINFNDLNKQFNCPVRVVEIINELRRMLLNHSMSFDSLTYFPFKQTLLNQKLSLKLRHSQNIIVKEILKNPVYEIKKDDLYRSLWPNDHSIQLNKLDTHLTNLKNTLRDSLNYNLIFKSVRGNLKFFN